MTTFTQKYFEGLLDNPKFRLLVCTDGNHLIGYIAINLESTFEHADNGYEVDTLYVQEHFKGKGIGRSLLAEVGSKYGNSHWLSTWIKNESAIEFYQYLGFKDIGKVYFTLEGEQHENRILAYG